MNCSEYGFASITLIREQSFYCILQIINTDQSLTNLNCSVHHQFCVASVADLWRHLDDIDMNKWSEYIVMFTHSERNYMQNTLISRA